MPKKARVSKKHHVKQSRAYKSLSIEEKLIYEFCLYKGSDGKDFELDYDEFIEWMNKMTNLKQSKG